MSQNYYILQSGTLKKEGKTLCLLKIGDKEKKKIIPIQNVESILSLAR